MLKQIIKYIVGLVFVLPLLFMLYCILCPVFLMATLLWLPYSMAGNYDIDPPIYILFDVLGWVMVKWSEV
jgi:hypothetical protein